MGVILMDCNTGPVTVNIAEPERLPNVARMTDNPVPVPVARPVALIVATEVSDEVHVTLDVMSSVLLSLYLPVAMYCSVAPLEMSRTIGVTKINCNVGPVTVRLVEAEMFPDTASIVVVPVPVPVAMPSWLISATEESEEDHVTLNVMFLVLPSVYPPVALNT